MCLKPGYGILIFMNNPEMIPTLHTFIKKEQLIIADSTIIIGLSGGPDSVFLAHFLANLQKEYNLRLIAAHLDHEWRTESFKDIQFCQQLCDNLGIKLVSQKISDLGLTLKFNGSKEEIGRKARRFFLEKVRAQMNAQAIALGHHAQDQQETFFIRLLRGASLSGLTAMKPKEGVYIRPLLHTHKADIVAFLKSNAMPYIIDPSNESDIYLRNRIRSNVIPALKLCDARFDANFMTTMQRLQETESFLDELTQHTFQAIATHTDLWRIDCAQLIALHPSLRYRILLHWFCQEQIPFIPSQSFFDEIIRFLNSPASRKHTLHTHWVLVKKKNLAWVEKII